VNASSRNEGLQRIARTARWTGLRQRFADALVAFALALPVPLVTALVCLATIKVRRLDWRGARPFLVAIALSTLVVLAAAAWQLLRRRPPLSGAIALDRFHGLHDRLANALYFSSLPAAARTPLMQMAIDDGVACGAGLRPRKAAPFTMPPVGALVTSLALLLALIVVSSFEVRTYHVIAKAPTIDAATLTADDVEFFRDVAKELADKRQDPEMRTAIDKFNQLVDDLANKRLDRTEAFRRMEALEKDLLKGTEMDKKALEEGLSQIAQELRNSDLSKSAAEALAKNDLPKAEQEIRDLAKKLKDKKGVDKAALDKLRAALDKAAKNNQSRMQALQQRREELQKEREELLKKKSQQDGGLAEQEERLLRNKDRALERLDRDLQQQRSAERQLERLDRELAQAAEDLLKDMGLSAQDLERSAEDLNRMAREQMTDQEKEELRKRIQELRELLRQQGQGGKMRMARLKKFSQAARGQRGGGGKSGQGGQDQEGDDEGEENGQQGGKNGKGGQNGEEWVIGPGGQKMLVVSKGSGSGQGAGQGAGQGSQGGGDQPGGQGNGQGGKEWGSGHDPNLAGKATNPKMGTASVTAEAQDTGQGPNRSEVIHGAAERGFVGRGYKKVFTEYNTVAERAIEKEDIPAGYRFYVQRYFQLIRPRGEE